MACSSMASAIASSLAPPSQDSVGARVLKKMGWRLGQGIGPRISYEQRKKQDYEAGFVKTGDEDDEEAKKHMYPRRDTPLLLVSRKDNSHGLGYTPGFSLNDSLGGRNGGEQKGPHISGIFLVFTSSEVCLISCSVAGFGLGALNDADEDDLDIYDGTLGSAGPKSRIVAYDAAEDDDQIAMGSSSRRRQEIVRDLNVLADRMRLTHPFKENFIKAPDSPHIPRRPSGPQGFRIVRAARSGR